MDSKIDLIMNKERLKLIIRNMESLVRALKSELDPDPIEDTVVAFDHVSDYDEVFNEQEDY
jgi:hypothetical protein